jgi:hypothetical protein
MKTRSFGWRRKRRSSWLLMALLPATALAVPALTATPLSCSTTFTDPSGQPQSVSFTGTASGTSLAGTLTVSSGAEQVTGTIGSDGSVSGKLLNPDGSQYGVFWGRRNGLGIAGSFDLNGRVGDWTVPLRLPIPTVTTDTLPGVQ